MTATVKEMRRDTIILFCEACDLPATEANPADWRCIDGVETFAHDECPKFEEVFAANK